MRVEVALAGAFKEVQSVAATAGDDEVDQSVRIEVTGGDEIRPDRQL